MKPEWCPQWAWDEADRLADVSSKYWHDIYWNGLSDITLNEHVARVFLDAHQRGRREGMEEAATIAETHRHPRGTENEDARWCAGTASAAAAIRAKGQ